MVCALLMAWLMESTAPPAKANKWHLVPVVNIPRQSMHKHKDAAWLFDACGVDARALLFSDEVNFSDSFQLSTNSTIFSSLSWVAVCNGRLCFQCSDINDTSYSEKHTLRRERKNMSVSVFQEQFNNSATAETNFLLSSCIHHHWCIKHSLEPMFTGIQWRGRGGSWREDYSHHHQCFRGTNV
jgi:hypothetical protein